MDRLPGHWNVEASSLQSSGLAASRAHRFGTNDMSYYGNDANKVGSKVHVNQRHHYPDDAVLKATLFKSLEGVKPEYTVIKRVPPKPEPEERPRVVKPSGHPFPIPQDKPQGKRFLRTESPATGAPTGGEIREYDRRHYLYKPSEQSDKITVDWSSRRRTLTESGEPAHQRRSDSFELDDIMMRKKAVATQLQQRNCIPVAIPGDKSYKSSEYSPNFYHENGLIPGSSIRLHKSGKPQFMKHSESEGAKPPKPLVLYTYSKKKIVIEKKYDEEQVRQLNNPTPQKGGPVPGWEERTGQWLCRPEDEND